MINYPEAAALVKRMVRKGLATYKPQMPYKRVEKEPRQPAQRPQCKACKSNRKPQFGNCANCGQRFVAL